MRSGLHPRRGTPPGRRIRGSQLHCVWKQELRHPSKKNLRMSRILKFLLALAAILAALIWFYPPARLLAIVAAGRSPVCPLSNAILADDNLRRQIEYKDRILKASK